jgi:ribosomal protein S18 acetylase RimI-like enzyme
MIRRARFEDTEAIVALENACFTHDRKSKLVNRMNRQIGEFPAGLLVAVNKAGVIQGYIRGVLQDEIDTNGFRRCSGSTILYICSVAVHPDHQGKGLGRALVRELRRRFPKPAFLVVEAKTGKAAKLYLSEGFNVTKRVPGHIFNADGSARAGFLMEAPAYLAELVG